MTYSSPRSLPVCVIGASRGSGLATVDALLARGHEVVAFSRNASGARSGQRLTPFRGDALNPSDVERAIRGCQAVVVTLGITDNPVAVRLGIRRTPIDVRSRGTANVVAAMQRADIRRLVVQTTYGIGSSKGRLSFGWSLAFAALLAPQIRDHERQEQVVRGSGLDWTILQPVGLVDGHTNRPVATSVDAQAKSMQVSRVLLAGVACDAVAGDFIGQTVAVSS